MEKSINKFEFKIAAGQDLPAIWFIPKKKEVCVFPLELFAILGNVTKNIVYHMISKQGFCFFPKKSLEITLMIHAAHIKLSTLGMPLSTRL